MPYAALTPGDIEAITTGLVRLSQQIDQAERPEDIAAALTPIVDRHNGVLHRIAQIFQGVGNICNDFLDQDPYAYELQETSDEAFDQMRHLTAILSGLDERFRSCAPDVTRIPAGQRPPQPDYEPAPGP